MTTPRHLLPTSCHVCGRPESEHTPAPARPGDLALTLTPHHTFWSNADALAEAWEHDRRVIAAGGPVYSSGARNAEAAYIDQHRPR